MNELAVAQHRSAVRRRTDWDRRRTERVKGKGIGVAGSAYISGAGLPIYWNDMPHSGAEIRIDRGGGPQEKTVAHGIFLA